MKILLVVIDVLPGVTSVQQSLQQKCVVTEYIEVHGMYKGNNLGKIQNHF